MRNPLASSSALLGGGSLALLAGAPTALGELILLDGASASSSSPSRCGGARRSLWSPRRRWPPCCSRSPRGSGSS